MKHEHPHLQIRNTKCISGISLGVRVLLFITYHVNNNTMNSLRNKWIVNVHYFLLDIPLMLTCVQHLSFNVNVVHYMLHVFVVLFLGLACTYNAFYYILRSNMQHVVSYYDYYYYYFKAHYACCMFLTLK
jgi:hypothetical protein